MTASAEPRQDALLPDAPLPFPELCALLNNRITAFLDEELASQRLKNVQRQTQISLNVIAEALDRYSLDHVSLAYNGGKDCLVLLILFLAALHRRRISPPTNSRTTPHEPIQCVYIQASHPFPEVEDFVATSVKTYDLSLETYAAPMKAAFAHYLRDFPTVQAIFVGTRRTDPHGANLTHFDPTDSGWPKFMRIHPVIDWHYAEIWTFIRHLRIPYCSLYDLGYTSLGGTTDTSPNPALRLDASTSRENGVENGDSKSVQNGNGVGSRFRPAYELIEDEEERLGRDK